MSGRVDIKYTSLFFENEFLEAENGATFEAIDPSTEELIAKVAFGSAKDVNRAVNAAKKVFEPNSEWRTMDASMRGKFILTLADLMERDVGILAKLITIDNGKPIRWEFITSSLFCLPSIWYLRRTTGEMTLDIGLSQSVFYPFKKNIQSLTSLQRHIQIMIDEVYTSQREDIVEERFMLSTYQVPSHSTNI
nr:retinal dehydrogenase 1-like [Lepeophtheirus salmonis]